jgi:hypothetical protein
MCGIYHHRMLNGVLDVTDLLAFLSGSSLILPSLLLTLSLLQQGLRNQDLILGGNSPVGIYISMVRWSVNRRVGTAAYGAFSIWTCRNSTKWI